MESDRQKKCTWPHFLFYYLHTQISLNKASTSLKQIFSSTYMSSSHTKTNIVFIFFGICRHIYAYHRKFAQKISFFSTLPIFIHVNILRATHRNCCCCFFYITISVSIFWLLFSIKIIPLYMVCYSCNTTQTYLILSESFCLFAEQYEFSE